MHAAVKPCFPPGSEGRKLWRLDPLQHSHRLYVVSGYKPDMQHIQEQGGWDTAPGETTDYDRFLDGLTLGQRYGFALTANPVKSESTPTGRGRVVPLVGATGQLEWFLQRTAQWGFDPVSVGSDTEASAAVNVGRNRDISFGKQEADGNRRTVTQRQVTYTGYLTVTDTGALRNALTQGIGRGKAYGCGLLTLARE